MGKFIDDSTSPSVSSPSVSSPSVSSPTMTSPSVSSPKVDGGDGKGSLLAKVLDYAGLESSEGGTA